MMRSLRLACIVWLSLVCPVWAASGLQYTRVTLDQARAIVSSEEAHDTKLTALAVLFGKFLDTDAMGRAALGSHWSNLTPTQQKKFLASFHVLLERTYVQKLLLFDKPDFAYLGEEDIHGGARVHTKIITRGDDFAVVYQLRPDADRWLATGITIEDVSLTANLGSQLDHLLSRESVEDLLDMMRRKYGRDSAADQP